MSMLQPREHPGQTDGLEDKYHTRALNRKSRSVSAPTGQMSTTLPAYGLSSTCPGTTSSSAWSPRLKIPSSLVFEISSVNRTHREQRMHRSWSSITVGPIGVAFLVFLTFCSANRASYRP